MDRAASMIFAKAYDRGNNSQQMRWARSGHLSQLFEPGFVISQGPLFMWQALKSEFYDAFIFMWVINAAITGRLLVDVSIHDVLVLEGIPVMYNVLVSKELLPQWYVVLGYQVFSRVVDPFIKVYSALTPLNQSWGLPSQAVLLQRVSLRNCWRVPLEIYLFASWITVVMIAVVRVFANAFF
jgi:hypothetical protein